MLGFFWQLWMCVHLRWWLNGLDRPKERKLPATYILFLIVTLTLTWDCSYKLMKFHRNSCYKVWDKVSIIFFIMKVNKILRFRIWSGLNWLLHFSRWYILNTIGMKVFIVTEINTQVVIFLRALCADTLPWFCELNIKYVHPCQISMWINLPIF